MERMHIGKISKRKIYTAEELLKKDPITGKLAREIAELERSYERIHGKKKTKKSNIKVEDLINELSKIHGISIEPRQNEYFIKYKGKSLLRTATRKYGISTGMRKDKNYITTKIKSKEELKEHIKEIKGMIE